MKLTVALGLQYDSNKSANLYAFSVGHGRALSTIKPAVERLPSKPISFARPVSLSDRWFILTYDPHGLPVMFPRVTGVDLYI